MLLKVFDPINYRLMGQNENLCCRGLSGGTWKEELDQGLLAAHQQNKITSKPTQTGRVGRVLFICGFCVYFLETIIYCQ